MRAQLDHDRIASLLGESSITSVVVLDKTDSTNAEVQRRGEVGSAVFADFQEGGRGRLGRRWEEIPYAGLAVSVLLPAPPDPGWMPLATGLALAVAVEEACGLDAAIKWPNDLFDRATGRKLAGILCELIPGGVVVGAGLNVDHSEYELPLPTATSIALALGLGSGGGVRIDREAIAAAFLRELGARHTALLAGGEAAARVRADYRARCATIGAEVTVTTAGGVLTGLASAVDDSGCLVVTGPAGHATVAAGDVHHVRPAGEASMNSE
ncbi:MAG: biotin--[acetyl-CoA-carboxylase] ligase [Tetrasphaera sp.]